jgi:hypothetical protein
MDTWHLRRGAAGRTARARVCLCVWEGGGTACSTARQLRRSRLPPRVSSATIGCVVCTAIRHSIALVALLKGSPLPHLRRDWAHPRHICAGTGLSPATSAPGLGSPPPHLRRDWALPCHICAGTGLTPATSAPGPGHSCGTRGCSRVLKECSAGALPHSIGAVCEPSSAPHLGVGRRHERLDEVARWSPP